jgi:Resolvase, N terminal domain
LSGLALIHCVLYAAKSTEDLRGSIPGQLRDCRDAVERAEDRIIAGEYSDEACSAYYADRGPGLVDALRHTEALAREHGTAELWAQHSDRLARGDGRTARHAVEIALWALKREVRVRTVHDPDTFRDLLYAVVTGQRNHEDSRRKGLALAAGRRRAAERGEYTGMTADGYRVAISIEDGKVVRRLERSTQTASR